MADAEADAGGVADAEADAGGVADAESDAGGVDGAEADADGVADDEAVGGVPVGETEGLELVVGQGKPGMPCTATRFLITLLAGLALSAYKGAAASDDCPPRFCSRVGRTG